MIYKVNHPLYLLVLSYICGEFQSMKKTHIIILVIIAALIVGLLSYSADFSTYDTNLPGKKKEHLYTLLQSSTNQSRLNMTPLKIRITFPFMLLTVSVARQRSSTGIVNQPISKKASGSL